MTNCKCGCGAKIIEKRHHKYYGTPKYLKHHAPNRKGKFKVTTNRNTMYTRSKTIKKPTCCKFSKLYQCKGRFEIHHIDGNIENNNPENLIELCTSHHRLIHSGKFDLKNPTKLKFRIDPSGKRRYSNG